jgi:hypothetical protein
LAVGEASKILVLSNIVSVGRRQEGGREGLVLGEVAGDVVPEVTISSLSTAVLSSVAGADVLIAHIVGGFPVISRDGSANPTFSIVFCDSEGRLVCNGGSLAVAISILGVSNVLGLETVGRAILVAAQVLEAGGSISQLGSNLSWLQDTSEVENVDSPAKVIHVENPCTRVIHSIRVQLCGWGAEGNSGSDSCLRWNSHALVEISHRIGGGKDRINWRLGLVDEKTRTTVVGETDYNLTIGETGRSPHIDVIRTSCNNVGASRDSIPTAFGGLYLKESKRKRIRRTGKRRPCLSSVGPYCKNGVSIS